MVGEQRMTLSSAEYSFLFDTHAHTDAFDAVAWREVCARALTRGVRGNLSAGVWPEQTVALLNTFSDFVVPRINSCKEFLSLLNMTDRYLVLPALGLHPMEIATRWRTRAGLFDSIQAEEDVAEFCRLARDYRDVFWALGETGFDASASVRTGWVNKDELLKAQYFAFDRCVKLALELNLPIILHSRSAWQHTVEALNSVLKAGPLRFMIHCYGGPAGDLKWLAEKGGFASFGGVASWPDAHKVQKALVECPESSLMFETDSPDLSPQLPDGQRPIPNEPQYLIEVVKVASMLRQQSFEELVELNARNFFRFLGLH